MRADNKIHVAVASCWGVFLVLVLAASRLVSATNNLINVKVLYVLLGCCIILNVILTFIIQSLLQKNNKKILESERFKIPSLTNPSNS